MGKLGVMIRERHKTAWATGRLARIAALPALLLASTAQGQAVQDYHLPPSSPSPTPTAAGPVDTDHPVATSTRPTPEPKISPSPVIELPAPAATQPAPRPNAAVSPRAEPQQRVQSGASAAPSATAVPAAPVAGTEPAPLPVTPTSAPSAEATPEATIAPAKGSFPWPWAAGGAAALALLGLFLFWKSRRPAGDVLEYKPEPAAPSDPEIVPAQPAVTEPPSPRIEPVAVSRGLDVTLEARHLSRALVNATLAYRLTLTNRGAAPLGPLRIAGDITSAHASLSAQEQLSIDGGALPPLHEVPTLGPDEVRVLSGELRLPIASILPIHSGGARVFVPLARFRVEAAPDVAATHVFVVGQASEQPGGALRPFALDRGPGVERGLDQRELELPV